jgi:hypothetical protein
MSTRGTASVWMFCPLSAENERWIDSSGEQELNPRLLTAYVGATFVIGVALAATVAAIIFKGYSRGWLLIPAMLFGGLGFAIRKMQQ